ncbi:MAG: DUF4347 domain-containing protein [Elainellaceae cyanobacterium]
MQKTRGSSKADQLKDTVQLSPASTTLPTHLVFVDSRVENYTDLLSDLPTHGVAILLNPTQDAIALISQTLNLYSDVRTIHLVAHGSPGSLALGRVPLDQDTLQSQSDRLREWQRSLASDSEILIYGCEVGAGRRGQAFVQTLHELTGATIAASSTPVGHRDRGGNWQLDVTTAPLRSELAFSAQTRDRYPALLSVLFQDSFTLDTVQGPWIYGTGPGTTTPNPALTARTGTTGALPGLIGGPIDTVGNGALRLTAAAQNQAAFVIYNNPISSSDGLDITFEFFMYGGNGADGINFFLIDGDVTPDSAGAFGGSLGYAQRDSGGQQVDGIEGGYLGIGFDAFGNYSADTEGRVGGPGATLDAVAVRGPGAGLNGYEYLRGTNLIPSGLDVPGAGTLREDALKTARILLEDNGDLTVFLDLNDDGDFNDAGENIIPTFNVVNDTGVAIPDTFKFGFAASTGGSTNIHEIRNLVISTANDPPTGPQADLVVRKAGPSDVLPGDEFTYNITVTNSGPNNATNVSLQDLLPDGLTFVSASNGGTYDAVTNTINWTPINLNNGNQVTYSVTVQAPATAGVTLENTAFVTGTQVDPNLNNNRRVLATNVVNELPEEDLANLRLTTIGPSRVRGGDTITYRIRVGNAGPDTAINLVTRSSLPEGLIFDSAPRGTYNAATGIVQWNLNRLASGASRVFEVTAIAPNRNLTVRNAATVRSATEDPNLVNNRDVVSTRIVRLDNPEPPEDDLANLRLSIIGPDRVQGGETVTYRVRVRNAGPDTATNVVTRSRLPEGLIFDSAPQGFYSATTGIVQWNLNRLASGAVRVFEVTAIAPNRNLTVRNRAAVRSATEDPNLVNNRDVAGTRIVRLGPEPPCEDCCEDGITLIGTNANNELVGTRDNDRLEGRGGDDNLRGLACDDLLIGGAGDDRLFGGTGDDQLYGGNNNDIAYGGLGDDIIYGNFGDDILYGRTGDDTIYGGNGTDIIYGGPGDDRLFGDAGNDVIYGTSGNNFILGGIGEDRLFGGNEDDRIFGGEDDDILRGGAGNDVLNGNAGNDQLFSGDGNNELYGGIGDDILHSGPGANILVGGGGFNTFVFKDTDGRRDSILDFSVERDLIDLSRIFADPRYNNQFSGFDIFDRYVAVRQLGSDTAIRVDTEGDLGFGFNEGAVQAIVILKGIDATQVTRDNFILAAAA